MPRQVGSRQGRPQRNADAPKKSRIGHSSLRTVTPSTRWARGVKEAPQRRRPLAFGNFGCKGSSATGGSPVDVSEMQRKLSQWATDNPEDQYRELYHLLCTEPWLRVAAHSVLKNSGSKTAGIDGMTKSNFLGDYDGNIARLKESLK